MLLRTKFILLIGSIVVLSYGLTFYRTYVFQKDLVYEQTERQARMLSRQILLTRKWVSDHNGIFLVKQPGIVANPFLKEPEVKDSEGHFFVKRNPAMVTRELAEYAKQNEYWRFRVTSLKPVNPANAPTDYERRSLQLFEKGVPETVAVLPEQKTGQERILHYMIPLVVEQSCLECHARHGYKVGDIRGGLSLLIPLAWAEKRIAGNNRMLLFIAVSTIVLVGATIFLLFDFLVVRRLGTLSRSFTNFPEQSDAASQLAGQKDEIGWLAARFAELGTRLVQSQKDLQHTRECMFQSEKLAALGRLAAGVAHEINNPLGGMRNCVKTLQENQDDGELRRRYLELIGKGLGRIEQVVRQLLNFGRKEPLRFRKAMVDDIVRECFLLLEYRLRNVELEMALSLSEPLLVDVEALKQIVVNIGLNAVQAMPEGGRLLVESGRKADKAWICFTDTGVGIPKQLVDKIFDPFFTTKEVGEGSGLGLAVSFALAERMGGTITVQSEEKVGSRFVLELPCMENPPGPESGEME